MGAGHRLWPLHRRHQPAARGGRRPQGRAAALAGLHGVFDYLRPRDRASAPLREPTHQVRSVARAEADAVSSDLSTTWMDLSLQQHETTVHGEVFLFLE